MPPADDFAAKIAALESYGLSRAEIASRAGISRTTIWRLANDANRDHLSATVQRVERLHQRIVGGAGNVSAGRKQVPDVSRQARALSLTKFR